jgi:hypothetical protein
MTSISPKIKELSIDLLDKAGISGDVDSIDTIHQGGNNQIFRVKKNSQYFIVKKYFQHHDDLRNRLEAEFSFLEFAYEKIPRFVPKPYVKNIEESIALYEYIDGVKITNEREVETVNLKQAFNFISALNKDGIYSKKILNASEACFSIGEHLNLIENRINELSKCTERDSEFKRIINRVAEKWGVKRREVYINCQSHNIDVEKKLEQDEKIISPSDFGFHNAIIRGHAVKFIDFEYSGWDDPAKLVGDFFGQVEIPVHNRHLGDFTRLAFRGKNFTEKNIIRSKILLDAYKVKWCCIVLNIFLEKNLLRRLFANPNLDVDQQKKIQLKKASKILESLT